MPATPTNPAPRALPHPGRGIVIISERESLGDGFYKLHLLRALKRAWPEEKITWIVSESDSPYRTVMAQIVAPYVDNVIVNARLRRPWREGIRRLRALPHYGLAIDNRSNNGVVAATRLLLPADLYQASTSGYLFCSHRPKGPRPKHKLLRLMALVDAVAGCPVDGSGALDLPPAVTAEAAALLPEGPRYIGLAPGASVDFRRWPLDNFIALARWIAAQGWRPAFLLGPYERPMLAQLRQEAPQALFPGCIDNEPLTSVELSLAVSRRFAAAVGHDTGASHLMAEAGTALVTLFGPSNSRMWAPYAKRAVFVLARDHGGPEIARIPVSAVAEALTELLA